ncbi:SH3 domain-containing protein [Striga asiatica]|uniref:SH3 domain-containing protein n=1 Tax=Striga asiatica TaxID=4170 RepID=A0A5A7QEG1_STRAF|nr:SH3 domain-containing protein [Striga asiatica]
MDALRKQASKFRDQVAKQQQAVIKQFSTSGYESSEAMVIDEVELQMHQQLEKLYRSTRSGRVELQMHQQLEKLYRSTRSGRICPLGCSGTWDCDGELNLNHRMDFQKDIVKAAEAFSAVGYKHIEAGTKLSEDCSRYGVENANDEILSKTASVYGDARKHVEKEQEDFNRLLFTQVLEPLRAMITGTPLEDARHLAQRYSRMRQEAEAQASEIVRRQARVRESPIPENVAKLHAAETRIQELKANMAVLGKEAAAALASVESQQQRLTFQRLVAMVEGERTYHERVATILGNVEAELVSEKQRKEAAPPVAPLQISGKTKYFLAEAYKELSLSVGDFVVVRNVSPSGWSEGECKGRAGWFPTAYVEKRQRIPANYSATEVY